MLLGLAAWQTPARSSHHRLEGWAVMVVPSLFAVGALAVLILDHFHPVSTLAVLLATATVLAAVIRAAMTFREVRSLAESRRQAHTDELTGLGNRRLVYTQLEAALQAKAAHSGWRLYAFHPGEHGHDRLQTIEDLRTAVDRGQLLLHYQLHYQPKVDTRSGIVVGVEALVRWQHPSQGLLYPDSFLPLAEQTGLMRSLTSTVLQSALTQVRAWRHAGLDVSVAVNLSVANLIDTHLPAEVDGLLAGHGLPASALELEITEGSLLIDPERSGKVLDDLQALGVRIAVDDYGTGYSSLAYLQRLPVDPRPGPARPGGGARSIAARRRRRHGPPVRSCRRRLDSSLREGRAMGIGITFPGESAEYRAARDRLLEQEIELRRAMEAVAAARRRLPPGGIVPQDYVFQQRGPDGDPTDVRLSELFAPGRDTLVIYSMMFPRDPGDERPGPQGGRTADLPLAEGPCPSCTALLDQLDGAAEHVSQRVNLAASGKAPLSRILTFAQERGWRRLRMLSSAASSYNRDYLAETAEGHQRPMLNVFQRDGETIRHFWGSELLYAPTDPGQDPRHVGTIEPLWNLYDLTPAGRGTDWDEQLSYAGREP